MRNSVLFARGAATSRSAAAARRTIMGMILSSLRCGSRGAWNRVQMAIY